MQTFNEWMENYYGYSWVEHERNLMRLGFDRTDIVEELLGLTFVWIRLELK
jgi:hypothetical protein